MHLSFDKNFTFYSLSLLCFINFSKEGNDQKLQQLDMQNPSNHNILVTSPLLSQDDPNETNEKWAENLLRDCAKAIVDNDSGKIRDLLWILNELSSPYGDVEQKLAYHFLQAFFYKATGIGDHRHEALTLSAEKNRSFEDARKVILKFQELSPWMTFGHVASNGAILEALEGETNLHIIDISNSHCTQWPTLMESLATRTDETPNLKLTVVMPKAAMGPMMAEIGRRVKRFARLMGVPLEFRVVKMEDFRKDKLGIRGDEALAVNFSGTLRWIEPDERNAFLDKIRNLRPKVITVVEEEADLTSTRGDFGLCFEECLRFYTLYFSILEESFDQTSDERLVLERECSRSLVGVLASNGDGERREKGSHWCERLMVAFSPARFSEDVITDVEALLKRYHSNAWSASPAEGSCTTGLYLTWKDEPVVWASAWKV